MRVAFERLGTFHRQDETQTRVVEIGARSDVADVLGVGLDEAIELRHLIKRSLTCVAATRAFPVDRTDLHADAACYQAREPVALKGARFAATQNELEVLADVMQDVGVRVDDHGTACCSENGGRNINL
jgi:hypothetical protein